MVISNNLLFCCMLSSNILLKSSYAIYLENNGYKDIVVSFLPSITYNEVNFQNLKLMLRESSKRLLHATKRRVYFSEITLKVPSSWPNRICEGTIEHLSYDEDITIIKSKGLSIPRTQHSRGCGESGEGIYLPLSWLDGDIDVLSRLFVQQWAFFRYGVFEESPISENSCYMDYTRWTWIPSGCYNIRTSSEMILDSDGLPRCKFSGDLSAIRSSLLFSIDNLPNVTDFCDGSDTFPHSPINPTRHNNLCTEKAAWEVIKNTQDFKYGINSPLPENLSEPQTVIKCYYQNENPSIFIAVQNSSVNDMTNLVTELRYTLLRFFLYDIPSEVKSSIMTFSDEVYGVINLNLQEPNLLETVLKEHIRVTNKVENVCIVCVLEEVVKVLNVRGDPDGILVFFMFASSLENMNVVNFKEVIRTLKNKLHFVMLQDTTNDSILQSIIPAIYDVKGQVFLIPADGLFMSMKISMALTSILRSRGQDIFVVHQMTFSDIKVDIVDEFAIDGEVEGQLLYMLKCDDREKINYNTTECGQLPYLPDSVYTCGKHSVLKATNVSKTWQFNFRYYQGVNPLTCMSLATVRTSFGHEDSLVFRGWLSNNVIRPGENALIIYAEVLKDYMPMKHIEVAAYIYEPFFTDRPIVLQLRDNGNGDPDVKEGDGIYSRYFTKFQMKGAYSVLIQLNPTTGPDSNLQENSGFSRTIFVGTFLLKSIPMMDIYPPNRIADLKVVAVDHKNFTATLQWTAPGDDYDDGQAEIYEVFFSSNWQDVTEEIISKASTKKIIPNDKPPMASGNVQELNFKLQKTNESLFYISLRALDKSLNQGKISNIVQIWIKLATEQLPENDTVTNRTEIDVRTDEPSISEDDQNPNLRRYKLILISSCVGTLLFLILLNLIVWLLCFRRQQKQQQEKSTNFGICEVSQISHIDDKQRKETELLDNPRGTHYNSAYMSESQVPQENENAEHEPTYATSTKQKRNEYLKQGRISNECERELGFV